MQALEQQRQQQPSAKQSQKAAAEAPPRCGPASTPSAVGLLSAAITLLPALLHTTCSGAVPADSRTMQSLRACAEPVGSSQEGDGAQGKPVNLADKLVLAKGISLRPATSLQPDQGCLSVGCNKASPGHATLTFLRPPEHGLMPPAIVYLPGCTLPPPISRALLHSCSHASAAPMSRAGPEQPGSCSAAPPHTWRRSQKRHTGNQACSTGADSEEPSTLNPTP